MPDMITMLLQKAKAKLTKMTLVKKVYIKPLHGDALKNAASVESFLKYMKKHYEREFLDNVGDSYDDVKFWAYMGPIKGLGKIIKDMELLEERIRVNENNIAQVEKRDEARQNREYEIDIFSDEDYGITQ